MTRNDPEKRERIGAGEPNNIQDPSEAAVKFFLNLGTGADLRALAEELGEFTNSVRVELNRLSQAGLLESTEEGRTRLYQANESHPPFHEVWRIVAKSVGLDKLVEQVADWLGNL